jgi:hypothetical protein
MPKRFLLTLDLAVDEPGIVLTLSRLATMPDDDGVNAGK